MPGSAQRRSLAKSVWQAGYALASLEQSLEGGERDALAAHVRTIGVSQIARSAWRSDQGTRRVENPVRTSASGLVAGHRAGSGSIPRFTR